MSRFPPVAVFAHRRPRHLRLALEALDRCPEAASLPVFVFCDAAACEQDVAACEATRQVARRWAAGRGGSVVERQAHLGFRNITSAVTELCDTHGRVIVIEDDIVVAPDFLTYVLGALERYRDDPRVFLVSGYMYATRHPPEPQLFFLPISVVWGWATWKRAWDHYEYRPSDWAQVLADPAARSRFDADDSFPFARNLEDIMRGSFDTWDTQWNYALFKAGGLGLYPHRSMIWNTGIDGGTHGRGEPASLDATHPLLSGSLTRASMRRPRLRPGWSYPRVAVDEQAWDRVRRTLASFGL